MKGYSSYSERTQSWQKNDGVKPGQSIHLYAKMAAVQRHGFGWLPKNATTARSYFRQPPNPGTSGTLRETGAHVSVDISWRKIVRRRTRLSAQIFPSHTFYTLLERVFSKHMSLTEESPFAHLLRFRAPSPPRRHSLPSILS